MTQTIKNIAADGIAASIPTLHGRSKIELFDAENGDKVLEKTDENMVTNALQSLFDLPAEFCITDNLSSRPCLGALAMPFYKKALSGILVFSETIPEAPDNYSPDTDLLYNKLMGFAGSEYAGASTMRGTLNANESGPIENGYRYVWDFPSDKANGVIKSLCLVPRIVGDLGNTTTGNLSGFGFSFQDYLDYNASNHQTGIIKMQFRMGQYGSAAGGGLLCSQTGYIMPFLAKRETGSLDIYCVAPSTGTIYVFPVTNAQSISIMDSIGEMDLRNSYRIFYEEEEKISKNAEYYNNYIYLWNCNNANSSVLKKIALDGTVESETTVNFDTAITTGCSNRVYDPETNMWYGRISSSSIKVFDGTGATLQTYSVSNSFCCSIIRTNGRKYIPISVSVSSSEVSVAVYLAIGSDGMPVTTVKGSGMPITTRYSGYTSYVKQVHGFGESYPYIVQGVSSSNSYTSTNEFTMYIALHRALPLLCTINNLSEQVIKTSAHTMKITYEIKQEVSQ